MRKSIRESAVSRGRVHWEMGAQQSEARCDLARPLCRLTWACRFVSLSALLPVCPLAPLLCAGVLATSLPIACYLS